jgi:hypothetical protein
MGHRFQAHARLSLLVLAGLPTLASAAGQVGGELKQWHAVSVTFDGPLSSETATPNPFTDYRIDVTFNGPSGQSYKVPGYYAADGNAGESSATSGNKWRVKFAPDAPGTWQYVAAFVQGSQVAAQPSGGASAGYFDGETGSFVIAPTDKPAAGVDLRGKGKLEYVNDHYLRFRNGSAFLKAGTNIPETFLEYADFDGTQVNLDYSTHVADWRSGDPTWKGGKGKGIIGAINYLSGLGINSMYFLTMNSHGDGKLAWPWTGADNYTKYDCSKLDQWDVVFSHMDVMGMMLHVVLSETENESYFEVQELGGAGGFALSRKIYYREMIARFGYHLAITWNIGEENGWTDASGYAIGLTTQQQKATTDYIRQLTYYDDNITVHNGPPADDVIYAPLLGHPTLTGAEIQWGPVNERHGKVLSWRNASHANGHRWVVSLDEPWPGPTTVDEFRIRDVWGAYLAGAGGCEYFQTGDGGFDEFRTKEAFYTTLVRAKRFIEDNVAYSGMQPADNLLSGATGYCLATVGEAYLVYLLGGGTVNLDLTGASGTFDVRWFDPRNGGVLQTGSLSSVTGGSVRSLGSPPNNPGLDWAVLVTGCPSGIDVYRDTDDDDFGDVTAPPVRSCDGSVPAGYAANATDCNDASASVYPGAPEINDGIDNQCVGSAGFGVTDEISGPTGFSTVASQLRFTWTPQSGATSYSVVRSATRGFSSGCTVFSTINAYIVDSVLPGPGSVFYYLVRPDAPHKGSWGAKGNGSPRVGGCLPL